MFIDNYLKKKAIRRDKLSDSSYVSPKTTLCDNGIYL